MQMCSALFWPSWIFVNNLYLQNIWQWCLRLCLYLREYWMIYRWLAFTRSRMIWLFPLAGRLRKRDNLLTVEGVGEEPNHPTARKPGSSLNRSILSGFDWNVTNRPFRKKTSSLSSLLWYESLAFPLKGQCHEIFDFWFFSWISFPQACEYTITAISIFFENSRRYSRLKVHHRCQRHRWQM